MGNAVSRNLKCVGIVARFLKEKLMMHYHSKLVNADV